MVENNQRETLICIGGPLNTRRLSVPSELRWFTLKKNEVKIADVPQTEKEVIELESIVEVADYSTSLEQNEFDDTDKLSAYVRTSFITGEKGLVHVLSFQEGWKGPTDSVC